MTRPSLVAARSGRGLRFADAAQGKLRLGGVFGGAGSKWWLWPVAIFVATRLISAVMMCVAQQHQVAITPDVEAAGYFSREAREAQPGYTGVATNWDAQWYWHIAEDGYPTALPTDAVGRVQRSAWAFPPLFPLLVRAGMLLTGLGFPVVALTIATFCSAMGVLLVYRLIGETAGTLAARITTLLLCTSMAAPTFQIAYTEGLALFLLTTAIWQLRREHYLRVAVVLWGLALTRHVVLPFLLVLLAHTLAQWREGHMTARRGAHLAALAASTVLATTGWPLAAAVVTGRISAFTETQAAWRKSEDIGPLGVFSVVWHLGGVFGLILLACAIAAFAALILRPATRSWGAEIRAWAVAYPIYLLAVAPAAVSLFRFWLLAFPLAWVFPQGLGRPRMQHLAVAVLAFAGLLAQWYWVRHFLVLGPVEQQFAMP